MRTCKRRNAQTCRVTALCAVFPRSPSSQRQCAECHTRHLLGRNARSCLHSISTWEIRKVAATRSLLEEKCAKIPSLALYLRRNAQSSALALYLRRNARSCQLAVTHSLLVEKCAKLPTLALYLRRNAWRCLHSLSTCGEMREVAPTRSLLEEKCVKVPSLALYFWRNARSCPHSLSTWGEMREVAVTRSLLEDAELQHLLSIPGLALKNPPKKPTQKNPKKPT